MKAQVNLLKVKILTGLVILTLFGAGIIYYLCSPSSLIAIDVNPSIELHMNRLGDVVSIDPVNNDAVQLMAGYQLTDKNLESVIKDIVDRMLLNGYLINPDTDKILVTTDKKSNSEDLLNRINTSINAYLQEKQLAVEVLDQKVEMDEDSIDTAHEIDASVGKMAVINTILQSNSSLSAEELAKDSIKELIQYANDHNISLEQIKSYGEVSRSQEASADITSAPDAVSSATQTTKPTTVPTDNQAAGTSTIIISTSGHTKSVEDAGVRESDLEDAQDNDSDIEDAQDNESDIEDAQGENEDREDADKDNDEQGASGKKTHNEDANTQTSGTDAVSGATLKENNDNDSYSEDVNEENDNEDNNLQEDRNHNYNNQDNENEDGNSQGDEGGDD